MSLRIRPPMNLEGFGKIQIFNDPNLAPPSRDRLLTKLRLELGEGGGNVAPHEPAPAAPASPAPEKIHRGGATLREPLPEGEAAAPPDKPVPPAAPVRPPVVRAPVTPPRLQPDTLQDYGERLVKLIPSEVVGIYLVGVGVIPATAKISVTVWAVVCLGLVVLARAYGTREREFSLPPQWKAVLISSASFVIWVYTIPGPFQSFGLAVPYVGSLAILVWTFVVPYFYTGA